MEKGIFEGVLLWVSSLQYKCVGFFFLWKDKWFSYTECVLCLRLLLQKMFSQQQGPSLGAQLGAQLVWMK